MRPPDNSNDAVVFPENREMAKGGSLASHNLERNIRFGDVLGVRLALVDYDKAVSEVNWLAGLDRPSSVSLCNTHLVTEAARDPGYGSVLRGFDLNLPDGMPVVWSLNRDGAGLRDRVYGPYLMKRVIESRAPLRHFFFGSSDAVLEKLSDAARKLNPELEIAGVLSPPFRPLTDTDNALFASKINAANPDCIWVALGGVRQETWISQNLHRFGRGVFLAVGDAFALLAGESGFAPAWMQRAGLTWLYRMMKDPSRLASRYIRYNLLFVKYMISARIKPAGTPL